MPWPGRLPGPGASEDRHARRRHGVTGEELLQSLVERYGYEQEATVIQDLFLSGDRAGSVRALTTLIVEPTDEDAIEPIAEIWSSV